MAGELRRPYSSHAEQCEPVDARVEGSIPSWLNGNLVRIGPGRFDFGEHEALYPMDGMGLLHSFQIQDGKATFRSKYISSNSMKNNCAEERYVAAEFGTPLNPDPKKGTFARLKDKVTGTSELSDNCNHNVVYWKQNNALLVIGLPTFVVDPNTLETLDKVVLPGKLAIDLVCEHAYVDKDGALYMLGSHVRGKPAYHVVKIPATGDVPSSFAAAEIVFTVNGQFKITPTSHHTFVMTDNFFMVVENPMEINVLKILTKGTVLEAIHWDPSVTNKYHVFNRKTGQAIKQKIESDAFLMLHIGNAYEENNQLIVDMFIFNKTFATNDLFVTRKVQASDSYRKENSWAKLDINKAVRCVIPTDPEAIANATLGDNLVTLPGEQAEAVVHKSRIVLSCRSLTASPCQIQYPCINPALASKEYAYFYAGGYGESDFLQFGIGKFDVSSKEVKSWEAKDRQYLTEAVFIGDPEGTSEDDGVLLFTLLDYAEGKDRMVILDAKTMSPLAQIYLPDTAGLVLPEADHGVFVPTA